MSFDLPVLPQDWSYAPLDSCSQPNSVTYGVVQPGTALLAGKPLIRVNNFRDTRIDLSDVMHIAPEIEKKYSRTRLKGGEVLLTIVGSVGQVAVVPPRCAGFNVARAVAVIHPLPNIAPEWIALCLRSPLSQHLLGSRANTTVQTTINLKDLRALPIPLPPDAERHTIAEFVGALDDRITLLRETNATLEAIAQALFKSWFVDFDPVRAKMAGRAPEGIDEATAALFPDGLEESALGLVPRGWQIREVSEVTKLFSGGTPDTRKPGYWVGDLRWFSSGETRNLIVVDTEKRINLDAVTNSSTKLALPGDILIASAGQGHTRGKTSYCAIETYINQSVVSVRVKSQECGPLWLFNNLTRRYPEMRDLSDSHSSRGSLTAKLLGRMPIVLPPKDVLTVFEETANALTNSQISNTQRVQTLATLRDTLLPRLISGQLRLPEVLEQVADAAVAG